MPDFTQPVELSFVFTTIGIIFTIVGICIVLVKSKKTTSK